MEIITSSMHASAHCFVFYDNRLPIGQVDIGGLLRTDIGGSVDHQQLAGIWKRGVGQKPISAGTYYRPAYALVCVDFALLAFR